MRSRGAAQDGRGTQRSRSLRWRMDQSATDAREPVASPGTEGADLLRLTDAQPSSAGILNVPGAAAGAPESQFCWV